VLFDAAVAFELERCESAGVLYEGSASLEDLAVDDDVKAGSEIWIVER
jgi:hypothetical protein